MAKLIPHTTPDDITLKPERDVARSLTLTLPEECLIYHSFPWLRPERNDRGQELFLRQGEADFVILSPAGLLVLEVKGGEILYEPATRRWYRRLPSGLYKDIRDPFRQASDNMHALIKMILEREFSEREFLPCGYGFAVVFPDCHWDGSTPPGAEKSVIFDAGDLADLGRKTLNLIPRWDRNPNPIRLEGGIRQKVRDGLAGTFRLLPVLERQVAEQEERLVQLTHWQAAALEGLYANDRLIVSGPAGSGKTMLAVATVKHLHRLNKRVLFLCYNRPLAEWLQALLPAVSYPRVTVCTFNSLCADWCRRARIPFRIPESDADKAEFFRATAAELLGQALDQISDRFDAVVVDEAQDFEPDWWLPVELLNVRAEEGALVIFHDPKQNLFVNKQLFFPSGASRFELPMNCRNTRRIAALCSRIRGVEIPSFPLAPDGLEPRIEAVADRQRRYQASEQQVKDWLRTGRLTPSQIAVLSPYRTDNPKCSVGGRSALGGASVTSEHSRWRNGEGILVTTVRRFKGLEADAIILTDVEETDNTWFTTSDLYVACSRAKHLLTIFTTELVPSLAGG